ncbi:MAG: hypothetical protein ACRELB_00795, partial [Polyangiaceae bacterium]
MGTAYRHSVQLFGLLLAAACGTADSNRGALATVVPLPALSAVKREPPSASPQPAWYFAVPSPRYLAGQKPFFPMQSFHGIDMVGAVRVSDDEQLAVLENGLRIKVVKGGETTSAAGLALPQVAAVVRLEDGTFVALGGDGAYARFRDPLGPVTTGRGSLGDIVRVTAGQHSFLAIDRSGAVLRSVDGGVTWTECVLPGPTGVNFGLFLRPDGSGQILRAPQHLLETKDDGATWTVADGDHWQGPQAHVPPAWGGSEKEVPVPPVLHFLPALPDDARSEVPVGRLLARDRLYSVGIDGWRDPSIVVRTAKLPLDAHAGESRWSGNLTQLAGDADCSERAPYRTHAAVAARGEVVVLGVACKKGSLILRSTDAGASFSAVALPTWPNQWSLEEPMLFVVPDGGVLVSERNTSAGSRLLRIARDGSVTKVDDVGPVGFDLTPSGRVAAIVPGAVRPGDLSGPYFLVSDDAGRTFRRVAIPSVSAPGGGVVTPAMAMEASVGHDDDGRPFALLVGLRSGAPSQSGLRAVLKDGDQVETSLAPWFDRLWLDGDHGIFLAGDDFYETSDGARSFLKLVAPGTPRGCRDGVCDFGDALRVGWEHEGAGPVPATALSSSDAPRDGAKASNKLPRPPIVQEKPALACTPDPSWSQFALSGDLDESSYQPTAPLADWLGVVRGEQHRRDALLLVREGGRPKPRLAPLLPPTLGDVYDQVSTGPYGIIALREHRAAAPRGGGRGAQREVHRIEVGWLDWATLTPHAAHLAARAGPWGLAQVVEDAALVEDNSRHLWILGRDGSVRELEIPSNPDGALDASYSQMVLGRSNEFVAIVNPIGAYLDPAPMCGRALFKNGHVTALAPWNLGPSCSAAGSSRRGVTTLWML